MAKKHYDNKDDIIRRMREVEKVQRRADQAVAASWSAFMMMGLLTLYEDLKFRDKRLNAEYDRGDLTLDEIKKRLYEEAGIIVEMPK